MKANDKAAQWKTIISEAEEGGATHREVAAKHGVSLAAFKYHFYKSRTPVSGLATKAAVAVLPVRVSNVKVRQVEVELESGVRLRFEEGCDPHYVAAIIQRLSQRC